MVFHFSSVGGVKRPAEGSKEEPLEKKNLPVVAKSFVSKNAIENRLPSSPTAHASPRLARAAVQVRSSKHFELWLFTLHLCCFMYENKGYFFVFSGLIDVDKMNEMRVWIEHFAEF